MSILTPHSRLGECPALAPGARPRGASGGRGGGGPGGSEWPGAPGQAPARRPDVSV